jgi:hypothetical protein
MLDQDARGYALSVQVFDGATKGLRRDDILVNITLCQVTNTAVTSARLYSPTLPLVALRASSAISREDVLILVDRAGH